MNPASGRIQIRQMTLYEGGGRCIEFEESFLLHIREPEEIGRMLRASGFADLAFFGSHDLEPFGRWSPDLLVLATRQGSI